MRAWHLVWVVSTAAACGDQAGASRHMVDAAVAFDGPNAADAQLPIDAPAMVRVYGTVIETDRQTALDGSITTIEGTAMTTNADATGDFFFDVPDSSRLIVRVPGSTDKFYLPMIRGVVAHDHLRPRNYYLLSQPEIDAAESALGVTYDPSTAILEVDFRNVVIGGYGVTLTRNGDPLSPSFGVVSDGNGNPVLSETTVVGGDGSTLLLAGLPPGDVSLSAIVPADAAFPCDPRDADPLPLEAGVVTWFDYECAGNPD
jgi:hypothetical protein